MSHLQAELYAYLVKVLAPMGCVPDSTAILTKLVGEVGELIAAHGEGRGSVEDEAADVAICLYSFAAALGFDLEAAMWRKHEINKGRRWARSERG